MTPGISIRNTIASVPKAETLPVLGAVAGVDQTHGAGLDRGGVDGEVPVRGDDGVLELLVHRDSQLRTRGDSQLRRHARLDRVHVAGAAKHAPGEDVGLAGGFGGDAAQAERLRLGALNLIGHRLRVDKHLHLRPLKHTAEARGAVVAPRERLAACGRLGRACKPPEKFDTAPRANLQIDEGHGTQLR